MKKNYFILAVILLFTAVHAQASNEPLSLPDIDSMNLKSIEHDFETGPPLQEVRVVRVLSDSQPRGENIVLGQQSTRELHTGRVRVLVYEDGYGTSTTATIKGILLPLAANTRVILLCPRPNGLEECRRNESAVAFFRLWDLGVRTGDFIYQSTSAYGPMITHSTFLHIN